ncbi:MAG: hypothetical protein ABSF26_27845, partial [Thermoguttaceae bacterium]
PSTLTTLRIAENNTGAVMLQADVKEAGGGTCSLACRLTAGQMIVEIRPEAGVAGLSVSGDIRHVVAADFFGDDMVFPGDLPWRPGLRLPVENLFLGLLDQGQAQVMCVWQPGGQRALAALGGGPGQPATIADCFIEAVKGKTIWVALLEGPDLWHEQAVSVADASALKKLDWRPPFPAKWRADLLGPGGTAASSYLPDSADADVRSAPAEDQIPKSLNPQIPKSPNPSPRLLIYAMDRNQATPLTTFCPIDVVRNTLGVGPCQYILQTEGLATDSNPTPDGVMTWIEKQFRQKKEKRAAGEIDEQLQQMVAHLGRAQDRIQQYGRLARRIAEWCRAMAGDAHDAPGIEAVGRLAEKLEQTAGPRIGNSGLVPRAARVAVGLRGLVGKPDALASFQRLAAEARLIGANQDRTLANCRMAVRWLKQSATMAAEDDPRLKPWAARVVELIDPVLQGK